MKLFLFINITLIFLIYLQSSLFSYEFQWPILNEKSFERVTSSTFGESRHDHFHAGLDIAGDNIPIIPIQSGQIMYVDTRDLYYNDRFYAGTGTVVFLQHSKNNISAYYHLKNIIFPEKSNFIDKNQIFAISGDTGRSSGPHLHFIIIQDSYKRIINPLLVLPEEKDSIPPVIENIAFIIPSKEENKITVIMPEKEAKIRLTKNYPIYLKTFDESLKKTRRIPYRIDWTFENKISKKSGRIEFNYLEFINDNFYLNGKENFSNIYKERYLKLDHFDYTDGINILIVTAYDYNRNQNTKKFILNIKKEY